MFGISATLDFGDINYISRSNNKTCERKHNHPMKNHMNSHEIRSLNKSNIYQTNRDEITITKQLSSIDTFVVIVFTVCFNKID